MDERSVSQRGRGKKEKALPGATAPLPRAEPLTMEGDLAAALRGAKSLSKGRGIVRRSLPINSG